MQQCRLRQSFPVSHPFSMNKNKTPSIQRFIGRKDHQYRGAPSLGTGSSKLSLGAIFKMLQSLGAKCGFSRYKVVSSRVVVLSSFYSSLGEIHRLSVPEPFPASDLSAISRIDWNL